MYQIHFGAEYSSGKYGWTTALEKVKRSVDWQLNTLRTDYIDYGFIHCLDEESDWDAYRRNGDSRNATQIYNQVIDLFPNTDNARRAESALSELEG